MFRYYILEFFFHFLLVSLLATQRDSWYEVSVARQLSDIHFYLLEGAFEGRGGAINDEFHGVLYRRSGAALLETYPWTNKINQCRKRAPRRPIS